MSPATATAMVKVYNSDDDDGTRNDPIYAVHGNEDSDVDDDEEDDDDDDNVCRYDML